MLSKQASKTKYAVLNTALGEAPEQTKTQIFLNHIDLFTIWHIKILHLFDDPEGWFNTANLQRPILYTGSLSTLLNRAFPDLDDEEWLTDIIWSDLRNAGFHRLGDLKVMMSENGMWASRTTELGKEFLAFINTPDVFM